MKANEIDYGPLRACAAKSSLAHLVLHVSDVATAACQEQADDDSMAEPLVTSLVKYNRSRHGCAAHTQREQGRPKYEEVGFNHVSHSFGRIIVNRDCGYEMRIRHWAVFVERKPDPIPSV